MKIIMMVNYNMKYIMNRYCKGTFNLSKIIDLNEILNQDEQKKFIILRLKEEKELTDEEFDWLEEIYQLIKDQSSWYDDIVTDYDIDDWDWYPEECDVIE